MFSIEHLEKVKKEYIKQLEETKNLIEDNINALELLPVKREVCKRIYEITGKSKDYNKKYDEYSKIYESHIQEFTHELEDLKLKIKMLDKMIEDV